MKSIIKVTKFPYLFYSTKEIEGNITGDEISIKDKKYSLEKFNKIYFLLIKYLPIIIFFILIFNQYDFSFANVKLIQYIGAIFIFILAVSFNGIGVLISSLILMGFAILGIIGIIPLERLDISYVVKYFVFIYVIYMFINDFKSKIFGIKKNGKLKAHLIKNKGDDNND